jgi:DNA-binding NtrC family response regulator
MVESLLFGHRRGAFTGAVEGMEGLIAAANAGTLFLDELSSLPVDAQVKLLRVLETGEVRRVGDTVKRTVCFRVVAAVQDDLYERVARGAFRLDLFQRVAGVVLRLPPLAERLEDLWDLCQHFAHQRGVALAPEVRAVVEGYLWPTNVRELKAAVARAGFLANEGRVDPSTMREAIELGAPPGPIDRNLAPTESRRAELLALMARHKGDVAGASREIGLSRSALYRRLKVAGLTRHGVRLPAQG